LIIASETPGTHVAVAPKPEHTVPAAHGGLHAVVTQRPSEHEKPERQGGSHCGIDELEVHAATNSTSTIGKNRKEVMFQASATDRPAGNPP
jgi:hypothetical protein